MMEREPDWCRYLNCVANWVRAIALVILAIVFAVLAFQIHSSGAVDPNRISGYAEAIDGDTLRLRGLVFRLWGVDAFERNQLCAGETETVPCGHLAYTFLRDVIAGRQVECVAVGEPWRSRPDRYGRIVAVCNVDGIDLGALLVRAGWALAYRRYTDAYVRNERYAREAPYGIWDMGKRFTAPWDWRTYRREW